jgi:broad specificity phosphatase PhoE
MADRTILVRHGETEWSKSGKHTSRTELELTPAGREAAFRLQAVMTHFPVNQILVSPRQRAFETASIVFPERPLDKVDDLTEWNYGDYEGLTTPEIREQVPAWNLWTDGCPEGESPAQVSARADRFLESVASIDGDVALVGHGHFLRVVAARYLGLSVEDGRHFVLGTATVSMLSHEHDIPAVELWNQPA